MPGDGGLKSLILKGPLDLQDNGQAHQHDRHYEYVHQSRRWYEKGGVEPAHQPVKYLWFVSDTEDRVHKADAEYAEVECRVQVHAQDAAPYCPSQPYLYTMSPTHLRII